MGSRQPARSGAAGGSGSEWSVEVIGFSKACESGNDPQCGVLLGFGSQMNESHRLYPKCQSTSHRSVLLVAPKKTGQKNDALVKYLPLLRGAMQSMSCREAVSLLFLPPPASPHSQHVTSYAKPSVSTDGELQ